MGDWHGRGRLGSGAHRSRREREGVRDRQRHRLPRVGPSARQVPAERRVPDVRPVRGGVVDRQAGVQSRAAASARVTRTPRRADSGVHRPSGSPEGRGSDPAERGLLREPGRAGGVPRVRPRGPARSADGHAGEAPPQDSRVDRLFERVCAQAHRGGGYFDDAFALRAVRPEPALRHALRHRAGRARGGRPQGHRAPLRRHERRHRMEV